MDAMMCCASPPRSSAWLPEQHMVAQQDHKSGSATAAGCQLSSPQSDEWIVRPIQSIVLNHFQVRAILWNSANFNLF